MYADLVACNWHGQNSWSRFTSVGLKLRTPKNCTVPDFWSLSLVHLIGKAVTLPFMLPM
jgi:hypothetical protein